MKNKLTIAGMLTASLLVYTCTVHKQVAVAPVETRPAFNPAPSAAYLSPEESMKTIHLQSGYHLELVASEPMVQEPVAITWDGNGRMYVAEMTTYMQDADATGEQQAKSHILLLEDTDNDGKMDKRTVFADGLLLPRMLQCVNNELLVNETNSINIYGYKDTNGDGVADQKKLVYGDESYKPSDMNMEHQRSGLDWNIDNWMYLTYDPIRFRYTNGKMQVDTIPGGAGGGQWGVTHDNYGRLFYSSAGGETPVLGFQINPYYGRLEFPDQISPEFQEVWPIIATPDVQGGFPRLRPNVTLNHFTACCGQSIYRGDRLPQNLIGDYIVCEPVGRIIRRAKVIDLKGKIVLQNNYYRDEFISSSDMNFRPVNSATGPDGNLYIVDMHHGIIQQANWTKKGSFLRQRIDSLGLAKNIGHGRIYRVVHDGFTRGPKPAMLDEASSKLITYLNHPNGWWRDNAQKELITRQDKSVIPALKAIASGKQPGLEGDSTHLARIHALWTLEGLEAIDKPLLFQVMKDENAQVRKAAIWIGESYLKKGDEEMIAKMAELKNDANSDVSVQLLLSLYQSKAKSAKTLVDNILDKDAKNEMVAAAKASLDRNENVKTFGSRLGNMAAAERTLILQGANTFKSLCSTCHGPDGKGISIGTSLAAPPLSGSKRLNYAEKNTPIRILLHGLAGPVDGKTYPSVMPSMGANSDEWVAAVVSYIRYEMGTPNRARGFMAPAIKPEDVKKIREENVSRTTTWTMEELDNKLKEELAAQGSSGQAGVQGKN